MKAVNRRERKILLAVNPAIALAFYVEDLAGRPPRAYSSMHKLHQAEDFPRAPPGWRGRCIAPAAHVSTVSLGVAKRKEIGSLSRVLALIGATLGSALGWWVGNWVGFMTALLLSVVGTAVGIYVGRRLARQYFS